jgi:hypothetical protein
MENRTSCQTAQVIHLSDYTSLFSPSERQAVYDALEANGIADIEHRFADGSRMNFFAFTIEDGARTLVVGKDRGEFYLANMRTGALWALSRDLGVVLDAMPADGGFKTVG